MKAEIATLRALFQKDVRYVIPMFQRPYVWTLDDQWEPLWEDVRDTAERYLEELESRGEDGRAAAERATAAHFLGAVVVQQQPTAATDIDTRHVIDGQQRLTTLQLLLDASQEVLERLELPNAARLAKYVLNDDVFVSDDRDLRYKVWPSSTDQGAFRHAMENEASIDGFEDSSIVQAHQFFQFQIEQWLDEGHTSERAQALEATLASLLEMVVIDLGHDDDPNVIFETLNARGTPLLASDLIKNLVLHTAALKGADAERIYAERWVEFDNPWWRTEVRQGRIVRPRIDTFLNYWLEMRTQGLVPASDVFARFRRYMDDSGETVESVVEDLREVGAAFKALDDFEGDRGPEAIFLYRLQVMDIRVLTPLLLWLMSKRHEIGEDGYLRCLETLESFIVRRMVCRMSSQNYSRLFLDGLQELVEHPADEVADTLVHFLGEQTSEPHLWPDDERVRISLEELPIYRLLTRGRLRIVLEALEDSRRSPKSEEERVPPGTLTIEHLMPQSWHAHWPLEVNSAQLDESEARREHAIHTIGNLTLVNDRLNPSMSNADWTAKREELRKHSLLRLNAELTSEAGPPDWDEERIVARSRELGAAVTKIWQGPDQL